MNTAFNLLHYPMQARQRRVRWRWASGLVGAWLGLAIGGGVLHGVRQDLDALAVERDKLLAQSARQRTQVGDDKVRREASALAQRQQALLVQVQEHQKAWVRLHQAVLQETGRSGWALERLQVGGDRLELQGRSRDAQALMAAQARLSDKLQSPLTLASLVASPAEVGERGASGMAHVFVWQAPWPSLPSSANRRAP